MNLKTISAILLIAAFYSFISCDPSSTEIKSPPPESIEHIESTLTELIEKGWDQNLFDIEKRFPGGELTRGDFQKGILACYSLDLKLTDLGARATVLFFQDEASLRKNGAKIPPPILRVAYVHSENPKHFQKIYKEILDSLQKKYPRMSRSNNSTQFVETLVRIRNLEHLDKNSTIRIKFKRGIRSKNGGRLVFPQMPILCIDIQYTMPVPIRP